MVRVGSSTDRPSIVKTRIRLALQSAPHLAARCALVCLMLACAAAPASAQDDCVFGNDGNDTFNQVTLTGGDMIVYVTRPHIICAGGVELRGDSAIAYSAQSLFHIIGNFRFDDATTQLTSTEARYFSQQARLQANGNVFVQDTVQGFTINDGNLIYLRPTEFREQAQIDVTMDADGIQPTALLTMKSAPPDSTAPTDLPPDSLVLGHLLLIDTLMESPDSAALAAAVVEPDTTSVPFHVTGNRIFIQGDSYFRSTGDVVVEREALLAYGDSADYNQAAGQIVLNGSARVDADRYDLAGRTIYMSMAGSDIDRVRSTGDAELTGQDLRLTSGEILLFLTDGLLDRLVSIYDPSAENEDDAADRPVALADDFEMTADSLDIAVPNEQLEQIFAAGTARSVSRSRDSLNVETLPEVARTDWLEGDTIIVTFVTDTAAAQADGSGRTVDQIVAQVGARSLYRLIPSDTTARPDDGPPAVHYVVGDQITIRMLEGEVDRMDVEGQTQGVHLEPLRAILPDSLATDTTAVDTIAVDTTGAVASTGAGRAPLPPEVTVGSSRGSGDSGPDTPRRDPIGPPFASTTTHNDSQPWRRL